jgi:hypothetical protein
MLNITAQQIASVFLEQFVFYYFVKKQPTTNAMPML